MRLFDLHGIIYIYIYICIYIKVYSFPLVVDFPLGTYAKSSTFPTAKKSSKNSTRDTAHLAAMSFSLQLDGDILKRQSFEAN